MPPLESHAVVATSRLERILIARLCRTEKRNAINSAMTAGIDAAMNELEDAAELWIGILAGSASVFSAGTDLSDSSGPPTERGGDYGLIRRRRTKPLLAAVEGAALGGGFELVLACDLVVASRTASFGLPEVGRGVIATCGGAFRGPRALPLNVAKQMLLTGDPLSATRAHELGLVNVLVEPGQALDGAIDLACRICANAPSAVRASLGALQDLAAEHEAAGWRATESALGFVLASEDIREGLAAFAEKRPPTWTGG